MSSLTGRVEQVGKLPSVLRQRTNWVISRQAIVQSVADGTVGLSSYRSAVLQRLQRCGTSSATCRDACVLLMLAGQVVCLVHSCYQAPTMFAPLPTSSCFTLVC